jgi:N-acetylmuramoyl-L-alanine amidase
LFYLCKSVMKSNLTSKARTQVVLGAVALLAACVPPPPAAPTPGAPAAPGLPAPPAAELPPVPAAGLPAVPRIEGPLQIQVVHPTPGTARPNVARTFIYGTVGTGEARLRINGQPVEVHPNGAFLAFLPVPADGRWELQAEARGETQRASVAYRTPAPVTPTPAPATVTFPRPLRATVTGGADTLATGSEVAIGRPTPTGAYRWFLPRGAALTVTGERGAQLRVRLGAETAWVPANQVRLGEAAPPLQTLRQATLQPAAGWVDVVVPGRFLPFRVETGERTLSVVLYDATLQPAARLAGEDQLVASGRWSMPDTLSTRLELQLNRPLWGYKAFYAPGGDLVLRIRRAPNLDRQNPFRGLRIVIDPGHPPGGATGPTGLTEAEANLAISLPLAEMLRQRGAEVILTRTEHREVSLTERVGIARRADAHLLVSVHNNAFPEGVDPFRRHGTSTYYFHPHVAPLARALQREIQATTLIPDLGALTGNLAMVRPTWMPAVLTESVFMPLPEQEAALRHPGFARNLAEAHVRGLERFLRQF